MTLCISSVAEANAISELLDSSIQDDIQYPAEVLEYVQAIRGLISKIDDAESAAMALSAAISPYATPSELLQMKLGWQCHAKGNNLSPVPDFTLVEGVADKTVAAGLFASLEVVSPESIIHAMEAINGVLGATGEELIVPIEYIQALNDAVSDMAPAIDEVSEYVTHVNELANAIGQSTSLARKALQDAVSITLTSNLKDDELMSIAVAEIMPAGVIDALSEEGA